MNRIRKSSFGVIAVICLFGGAGCAVSGESTPPPAPSPGNNGLAAVNPCSILQPDELDELGLDSGDAFSEIEDEPGCDYSGRPVSFTIAKNQNQTVESYANNSRWASYKTLSVNGRPGAQAVSASAQNSDMCFTLFDAGGGVIVIAGQKFKAGDVDECAESLKLAERIEPRMPR